MATCPSCHTQLAAGVMFCPECGARIDSSPPSPPAHDQPTKPPTGKETIILPALQGEQHLPGRTPPAGRPADATLLAAPAPDVGAPPTAPASPQWAGAGLPPGVPAQIPPPAAGKSGGSRIWLVLAIAAGLGLITLIALIVGVMLILRRDTSTAGPTASVARTARPTAVSRPTAEVRPTTTSAAFETVLLEDNFNNPGRSSLDTGETDDASYAFEDGAYVITLNRPKYIVWSPFKGSYSDASFEFEATIEGPKENAAGMIFRFQDAQNFYMFVVSGDGRYSLDRYQNDELKTLIEWTESAAIKGVGETNFLRIETSGSRIRLFANDELLDEISDDTFIQGEVALAVSTFDEGGATARFDNAVFKGAP